MPLMIAIGGPKSDDDDDEKPSHKYGRDDAGEAEERGISGMARRRAAKAVMSALESGDVNALDEALAEHYRACAE